MFYNDAYILPLNKGQFFEETTKKQQIVLHHTVSSSQSVKGDVDWWNTTPERVGTHFLISGKGVIYQTISLDYWIHHLAVNSKSNKVDSKFKSNDHNIYLNKRAIGIELDSAGGLTKSGEKWLTSFNTIIPTANVIEYSSPIREFKGFEKYSEEQIVSLKKLLLFLTKFLSIDKVIDFNFPEISVAALEGQSGIFSHTSYRTDKSDIHPQPSLIQMLRSL